MIQRSKLSFLVRIIRYRLNRQPRVCPYCGLSSHLRLLKRKKLLLDIVSCESCKLIFRWPMDTQKDTYACYQHEYKSGATTALPGEGELDDLLRNNLVGTPLDLGPKIRVLKAMKPTGCVLDYGCSWGYGTYQLAQHGFQAIGFEISKPRAQYGREKLGVEIIDNFDDLRSLPPKTFDIVFTNHVLEHLTSIKEVLDLMFHLLREGGLAFHVLPNFTGKKARRGLWLRWIGEAHPIAPTTEFFEHNLSKHGFDRVYFASSPFDDALITEISQEKYELLQTDGNELLVLVWRGHDT